MTLVIAAISNPRALGALAVLAGILLAVVGVAVAASSCGANGLFWIGAGCTLAGLGGSTVLGRVSVYVGGVAGVALVVAGLALRFTTACPR